MDITERLLDWQDYEPAKMFGGEILKDMTEAAAEIDRLRATEARLRAALANAVPHLMHGGPAWLDAKAALANAEAEKRRQAGFGQGR